MNAPQNAAAITLVVPLFNEEEGVALLASSLDNLKRVIEAEGRYVLHLRLVDDGSTDGTFAALQRAFAAWPNQEILRHPSNQGIAAAIMTGLHSAQTEIACSLDADCTYDPLTLVPRVERLTDGVDLVTASPYHPEGMVLHVPRWRLWLSKAASRLYRLTLGLPLHTFTSCCRVYRRSAVVDLELRHGGFQGVAELLVLLALRGGTIVEQPAVLSVRRHGKSKMRLLRTIFGHLGLLIRTCRLRARVAAAHALGSAVGSPSPRTPQLLPTQLERTTA
jgi:glycosyltransferase involved in cell wall biosynthesis